MESSYYSMTSFLPTAPSGKCSYCDQFCAELSTHELKGVKYYLCKNCRKDLGRQEMTKRFVPPEWIAYCESGNKPDDIPDNPDEVYADEWISWSDFLGYEGEGDITRQSKLNIIDTY